MTSNSVMKHEVSDSERFRLRSLLIIVRYVSALCMKLAN